MNGLFVVTVGYLLLRALLGILPHWELAAEGQTYEAPPGASTHQDICSM
jgi:hypothetical protein